MEQQLIDVIGLIYEAAAEPTKWPALLGKLVGAFTAANGAVHHVDRIEPSLTFTAVHEANGSPGGRILENTTLLHQSIRATARDAAQLSLNGPQHNYDSNVTVMPTVTTTLTDGAILFFSVADASAEGLRALTTVLLARTLDEPPFTERERQALDHLAPHVKRAGQIRRRIARDDFDRRNAMETLDSLAMAVVVCGRDGRVRSTNRAARVLVNGGLSLRIHNEYISSNIPKERAWLLTGINALVDASIRGEPTTPTSGRLSQSDGSLPLPVLITPVWGELLQGSMLGEPLVAILVSELDNFQCPASNLLAGILSLSPSEGLFAARLAAGDTVEEAAATLGITLHTARSRLKIIFHKTGATSQAKLMAQIAATPAWWVTGLSVPQLSVERR